MKSNSDIRPETFINLGDGSWQYNFNVREIQVPVEGGTEGETRTAYEYESVIVWGYPTFDKCVKAVLRDRRDETQEFNLVNRYNAYVLGVSEDEADRNDYIAYLREVKDVKAQVERDIEEFGNATK